MSNFSTIRGSGRRTPICGDRIDGMPKISTVGPPQVRIAHLPPLAIAHRSAAVAHSEPSVATKIVSIIFSSSRRIHPMLDGGMRVSICGVALAPWVFGSARSLPINYPKIDLLLR